MGNTENMTYIVNCSYFRDCSYSGQSFKECFNKPTGSGFFTKDKRWNFRNDFHKGMKHDYHKWKRKRINNVEIEYDNNSDEEKRKCITYYAIK